MSHCFLCTLEVIKYSQLQYVEGVWEQQEKGIDEGASWTVHTLKGPSPQLQETPHVFIIKEKSFPNCPSGIDQK